MAKRAPAAQTDKLLSFPEPRRDKQGRLLVTIRDQVEGPAELRFKAALPGWQGEAIAGNGYGATPRLALTALLQTWSLAADLDARRYWAPYGGEAHRLLSVPFKRPGQNPGGKPRRVRDAAQAAKLTIGLTLRERALLKNAAEERGFSEAELCRQGLRTLGVLPGTDPSP